MNLTESCGCGAALTVDEVDTVPWTLIREWRAQHAACRQEQRQRTVTEVAQCQPWETPVGPPLMPPPGVDAWPDPEQQWVWPELIVDPERFFELVGRRAAHDGYGPSDSITDSARLSVLADYIAGIDSARGVESRVPGDLRRIAADLAIAESWVRPADADVPLPGLRQLLSAINEQGFYKNIEASDSKLNVYVAKGDTDPDTTWCSATWVLATGEVAQCARSLKVVERWGNDYTVDVPGLAAWIRDGMPT
jgi:hypothetical protein